ncbi:hypothetical protein APA_4766 [Pseudanabaena sp. lw0831]|nr:hypothetical protein APA_4766 [Pseudanabaena sp. lw0831]
MDFDIFSDYDAENLHNETYTLSKKILEAERSNASSIFLMVTDCLYFSNSIIKPILEILEPQALKSPKSVLMSYVMIG